MDNPTVLLPDNFEALGIREDVKPYLLNPDKLTTTYIVRRGLTSTPASVKNITVKNNEQVVAELPDVTYNGVPQKKLLAEYEPASHSVTKDEGIPSISVRVLDGYAPVADLVTTHPYQKNILAKDVIHICGNKTEHTLLSQNPTKEMEANAIMIKEYWEEKVIDGVRNDAVRAQKKVGCVGWLFYHNYKKEIACRALSYPDYTICPHYDRNKDPLIHSVYYTDEETKLKRIDSYDEKYRYSHIQIEDSRDSYEWRLEIEAHGFSRMPLLVQTGEPSWNDVQNLIDAYETIYNIFLVIMKRHGWGILYLRGNINQTAKKIAGSVIMQDSSLDGNGMAEFKAPPSPDGMFAMLESLEEQIQIGARCTFLLPKDIKSNGDVSGLAIQLTQSGDIEKAIDSIADWQKTMNDATALFIEGLAKELVNKGIKPDAVTEFAKLRMGTKMQVFMPKSQAELVQTITTLKGAGLLSQETAIEIVQGQGLGKPSEKLRVLYDQTKEAELAERAKTETIKVEDNNGENKAE